MKKIFTRLSKEEIETISIVRLEPTYDNIVAIIDSLQYGFSKTYTYEDIKKTFNIYTYYAIKDTEGYSIVGVKLVLTLNQKDYIRKVITGNNLIVISGLVSRKKGRGSLLMNYVINKYHNLPMNLTARSNNLIQYYKKFGFESIMTDKQYHYPMIKQ